MAANIKTVQKFVRLTKKKEKLEEQLKHTKNELNELEERISEYFSDQGMQSMRVAERTVFIRKEVWASLRDKEAGCAALREADMEWLVRPSVNAQQLSAWVREQIEKAGEKALSEPDKSKLLDVSDAVRDQIRITEKYRVACRR